MFQFEFDPINRILRCRFEGLVTDGELIDYYRLAERFALIMDPRAGVADFVAVTRFEVSPTTIRRLAESPPAISDPNVPRFVVAPSHPAFGLSRLFELIGEATRPNLYVVRAPEQVWMILNIQEPRFEAIQPSAGG